MATCYRANIEPERSHLGPPFYRCAKCQQVVCYDCIGENLTSGAVLCIACASIGTRVGSTLQSEPVDSTYMQPVRMTRLPTSVYRRPFWPILVQGVAWCFTGIANVLLQVSAIATAPFREVRQPPTNSRRLGLDLTVTSYTDKVQFAWAFVAVVLVCVLAGIIYSDLNSIPLSRFFLATAATLTFWGIMAVYLQYFFDRALGRPMSQIIAYLIAFFLALILGGWLIQLKWLDRLLGNLS